MLSLTAELVAHARTEHGPIVAFNVITLEHAQAVIRGAALAQQPVIVQVSENAARYHDGAAALLAACRTLAEESETSVALHLDHVESRELLDAAPTLGVSSVMVDASRLPDEENIEYTRRATEWAHKHGLFVEAELGAIGGKGNAHTPGVRTDPADAARYVAATGVDALAVAVGSNHAMTARTGQLDQSLIRALAHAVGAPLVLHGSSGIPDEALQQAIINGIVKINVGTLLNVAFTGGVRGALDDDPAGVDPRRYLARARSATQDEVSRLLRALNSPYQARNDRLEAAADPRASTPTERITVR